MKRENQPMVAVGPVATGWGSWDWVGRSLLEGLTGLARMEPFAAWTVPEADLVVVVKHPPPPGWVEQVAARSAIIYCPVDWYGSVDEVAADAGWLRRCHAVVVHARPLIPVFAPYARTEYLDHPLRYTVPPRTEFPPDGRLLWVGVRSNLPALVAWVNAHPLPGPLDVLTNPERPGEVPPPAAFGFAPGGDVRVLEWSAERHRALAGTARAALDVKGSDFRSRHKPPAKALDFVASGLPLALNPGHPAVAHLAELGLAVPSPADPDRWFSERYWLETRALAQRLAVELSPEVVTGRAWALVSEILKKPAGHSRRTGAIPGSPLSRPDLRDANGSPSASASGPVGPDRSEARPGEMVEPSNPGDPQRAVRVAVLSLLFNWPSTGGGTVHTAELCRALADAGYAVRHLYARYDPWAIGQILAPTPHPAEELVFEPSDWTAARVIDRFAQAIDRWDPDYVLVTDSWSFKPLLARAAGGRPVILRLQAQEGLCPLNNVRLRPLPGGPPGQCPTHQLADPGMCGQCVRRNDPWSGDLHRAERALSGFGSPEYQNALVEAFAAARAVLVVNPITEALVGPYAQCVRVVPSGMDPARFPAAVVRPRQSGGPLRILFAGLAGEWIKGFAVLREAARRLWATRRDFEIVVTDQPSDQAPDEPFLHHVGWQSQADLPGIYHEADVVAVPAVAQEALGRTAVEGMATGRPVVAARIGGLPFTVLDEGTGLLFDPGDPADLARQLARLLDDPDLRARLGAAGRARFERSYAWPAVVERHYRAILTPRRTERPESNR